MFKIPEFIIRKKPNSIHNEYHESRKPSSNVVKFPEPPEKEEIETNTNINMIGGGNNCIHSGVIFGDVVNDNTNEIEPIASVTITPNDMIDSSLIITVMDKNNNIIAETDDIGLIGIAVKGDDDIRDLTCSIGSISAALITEFDKYYHRSKSISTKDYWKKYENE